MKKLNLRPIMNNVASCIRKKFILIKQFFTKNQAALLLLIGLVALSAIIYVSQNLLFLSPKNREIVGVTLYSVAGFFLVLDQIIKIITKIISKGQTSKKGEIYRKLAEWLSNLIKQGKTKKGKIKISLFLLPIIFLIAYTAIFIFQAVSTGEKIDWGTIAAIIFAVLIISTIYLFMLKYANKLFDKLGNRWQKLKSTANNMLYSNIFLFVSSLALGFLFVYLLRLIGTSSGELDMPQSLASTIWYFAKTFLLLILIFFIAFIIVPAFILPLLYFIVLGSVWLTYFFQKDTPRLTFWIVIFMLWVTGTILLLMNAFAS